MKRIRLYLVVVVLCISTLNAGWFFHDLKYFPTKVQPNSLRLVYETTFSDIVDKALVEISDYPKDSLYTSSKWYHFLPILYYQLSIRDFTILNLLLCTIESHLRDEQLIKIKRLLVILGIDHLIFFVLFHLDDVELSGLLQENKFLRDWCERSMRGQPHFVNEIDKAWLDLLKENNPYEKHYGGHFLEMKTLFNGKEVAKDFLRKLAKMLLPYNESYRRRLRQEEEPVQIESPKITLDKFFKDHAKLLCSTLIIPCVASIYTLFRLKRIGTMFRKKSCWIHWNHLSLSELEELPPERIVDLIIPDILMRSHSKKVFRTNEKILNDFLHELEYERKALRFYRIWSKRMRLFGPLVGIDHVLASSASDGSKKLELLHQKVWDYIMATKSMKTQVV